MADADPGAEVAAEDPNPTVSLLSARSLETDGDSEDDADFDPVKSGDEASSDDDDGSGDDDEDDDSAKDDAYDDDEVARAVKASFLRSFGEPDERIDDDRIAEAAATVPGDAAADDDALPLGDAEMERLFDTDESDTDEDDSDDEDEDVSLVPEESNVLNASAGLLVPGPEYSPSASVSAVTRPPLEKEARASPSESRKSIPRELFPYSPSLKRAAREREEALGEAKSKRSKPAAEVPESPATRASGARRALEFDPGRVQGLGPRSAKESGGGGGDERSDDPKGVKSKAASRGVHRVAGGFRRRIGEPRRGSTHARAHFARGHRLGLHREHDASPRRRRHGVPVPRRRRGVREFPVRHKPGLRGGRGRGGRRRNERAAAAGDAPRRRRRRVGRRRLRERRPESARVERRARRYQAANAPIQRRRRTCPIPRSAARNARSTRTGTGRNWTDRSTKSDRCGPRW